MSLTTPVKYTVGIFVGLLVLLGGLYSVGVFQDKIVVTLPSDVCNDATLRVTKDDFTLKCGDRIAFQADTITEYFKTYGTDEWVKNDRYVGRNKNLIDLSLYDYKDYFDIVRTTRYHKGTQSIEDGILKETFTFTKDSVKISYDYSVKNNDLHRVSMRIKRQSQAFLDASDKNGYTGVLSNNILSYEGFGNLLIDPIVSLTSPASLTREFNEGEQISFVCNATALNDTTLRNISLYWTALNESWMYNGTTAITGNATATFTRTIPHLRTNGTGTFVWNCIACNTSQSTYALNDSNCTWGSANFTVDPRYRPHTPFISAPDTKDLNLLNGSGTVWNMSVFYPRYINASNISSILINWTWEGMPDNNTDVYFNLSYFGTLNTTRFKDTNFNSPNQNSNASRYAYWEISTLKPDRYYLTLHACNALNETLCSNYTITNPVDIFDYAINISTGETKIRFNPLPTITKGAALGQTDTQGIIRVDWLGYSFPDGKINLTLNLSSTAPCMSIYANNINNASSAVLLVNNSATTAINTSDSDPDYIWLWADKISCGTTTTAFQIYSDLCFGGT